MRIENSVTRVTVWHHETRHHDACRLMWISYPEWRNFQFAPDSHFGLFFLHTPSSSTAFNFKPVNLSFYTKISTFFGQEKFGSASTFDVDVVTFGRKLRQKPTSCQNWRRDVKKTFWRDARESSYTPFKTTFHSPGRVHGNSSRVCKKKNKMSSTIYSDGESNGSHLIFSIHIYPTAKEARKLVSFKLNIWYIRF